ncbi:hypothetical protein FVEN_g13075 [Fusarium venenatum]|nr:hypothetical protein FVEN_g13075 [Fusarium venenatum]
MEMLDTAPDCLDPATRSAAESWMTSVPSPEQTILFALKPPYPTLSMISSQDIIFNNCFIRVESALRKRLNVIVQLVEVILFLRVVGFVHKNITSPSIATLQLPDPTTDYLAGESCL